MVTRWKLTMWRIWAIWPGETSIRCRLTFGEVGKVAEASLVCGLRGRRAVDDDGLHGALEAAPADEAPYRRADVLAKSCMR